MSYRELRNFTEMMRYLGYGEPISLDAFRRPNFVLVYEVLRWLVKRYDPDCEVPTDIETEPDRVFFLKATASVMYSKARIKLNQKNLYKADGYAVKELLKIASVLCQAARKVEGGDDLNSLPQAPPAGGASELEKARRLASEITSLGADLHDMLQHEDQLRRSRNAAISQNLDLDAITRKVKQSTQTAQRKTQEIEELFGRISSDESHLESKISKKQDELARNRRRLDDLAGQRPAFMDEFERLEEELRRRYDLYIERFRNMQFLERELDKYTHREHEAAQQSEEQLAAIRHQMQQQKRELMGLEASDTRRGGRVPESDAYKAAAQSHRAYKSAQETFGGGSAGTGAAAGGNTSTVYGDMMAGDESTTSSSDDDGGIVGGGDIVDDSDDF